MVVDILVPQGNEQDLAEFAKNLGFKEIIFLYDSFNMQKPTHMSGIVLKTGFLAKNVNDVGLAKTKFDYVFAPAERQFFESKKVDFVVDAESSSLKDFFFQKRGGLDDAMCKLAKVNGLTLVFNASVSDDKSMLGRLEQNARLCRRHKLKFAVATFARKPVLMRSPGDLVGFARYIGLC